MPNAELLCDQAFDRPPAFTPCAFRVKRADAAWEVEEAMALRRAVFCAEQGIFVGHDRDAVDGHARTLVAVSQSGGMPDQVVGTVRIHEASPGVWWGSRLAVHAAFRHHGRLGATLIRLAVCSAHALGCERFFAQVQSQNVALFEKLGWLRLADETLHGRPHARMQASLDRYPPCHEPEVGFFARSNASARQGATA
jgi:putative N-acetyltransferase (TIGR04045 family)